MKICWITGTKGGCGKSIMAALMVDYYIAAGKNPVIVEADGSVPDVGRRYDGIVDGILAPIGGNDPADEIYKMLEGIEEKRGSKVDRIVINLPGNTSVVEAAAQDIMAVTEAMEITNNVIFMLAENEDSASLCAESLDRGLCSISDRKVAVINTHFGRDADKFAWTSSAARKTWLKAGLPEAFLPDLHERVREIDEVKKGRLSLFTGPGEHGLTVVNQMIMRKFVKAAFEIGDLIEKGEAREVAA